MSAESPAVAYRTATPADLESLGEVYLATFPGSLEELQAPHLSPRALADLVAACLRADPGSVIVAEAALGGKRQVVGYVLAVSDVRRVWRAALFSGLALRWAGRLLRGEYRLPCGQFLGLVRDKARLWRLWRRRGFESRARVLSLAVRPEWQGRGVGTRLMELAIGRLQSLQCGAVALEVRSDNLAAQSLYRKLGFRPVGEFRSTRGPWLVMRLALRPRAEGLRGRRIWHTITLALAAALLLSLHAWMVSHLRWRAALRAAGFQEEMAVPGPGERLLIVAPHPDDEVLGCGGLIQQALQNGAAVSVVLMTNGDASELGVIFGEKELPLSPKAYLALGRRRQKESLAALARLGVPSQRVFFLGYPNNGLTELWQARHWPTSRPYRSPYTRRSYSPYELGATPRTAYCGASVLADLTRVMDRVRPTAIFAPHPQDIHPDHWATSAFVHYALATEVVRGREWASRARLYGYLIHWPGYPVPRSLRPTLGLVPPAGLARHEEWLRLSLSREQVQAKLQAIMLYRSQVPRFDNLLKSFARTNESFASLRLPRTWEGGNLVWEDEDSHRRGFGGAEVTRVEVARAPGDVVRIRLTTPPAPVPGPGALMVDVKGWEGRGAAQAMTISVEAHGGKEVAQAAAGRPPAARVTARSGGAEIKLDARALSGAERNGIFFTCWGSARPLAVDPAVVSWLRPAPREDAALAAAVGRRGRRW